MPRATGSETGKDQLQLRLQHILDAIADMDLTHTTVQSGIDGDFGDGSERFVDTMAEFVRAFNSSENEFV